MLAELKRDSGLVHAVHHARSRRGRAPLRPRRGHVCRSHRRERTRRAGPPPRRRTGTRAPCSTASRRSTGASAPSTIAGAPPKPGRCLRAAASRRAARALASRVPRAASLVSHVATEIVRALLVPAVGREHERPRAPTHPRRRGPDPPLRGAGAGPFARPHPPVRAVEGVELTIGEGEAVGLLGESGCGKTTLSRMLLAAVAADAWRRAVPRPGHGAGSTCELRDFRRAVQPVFQDPYSSLDPRMTVGRIVAEPLRAAGGLTRAEPPRARGGSAEQVELDPTDASRYPREFSGGQRQRIAVARALVSKPQVIILDEAVSSQDVSIRAQLLNLLKDIQREGRQLPLHLARPWDRALPLRSNLRHVSRAIVESGDADTIYGAPRHATRNRCLRPGCRCLDLAAAAT